MKTYAILLASGTGTRFGGEIPKQFVRVDDRMIVEYAIEACVASVAVDEIVVVVPDGYLTMMNAAVVRRKYIKPVKIVRGGCSRRQSALMGLQAIADDEAKVLIHNAVQPFVADDVFSACAAAFDRYDAVTVGVPLVYTVLEMDENRVVRRMVDRRRSVNDLGPECFRLSFIRKIFDLAGPDDSFTNLNGMVMKYSAAPIYVVEGDPSNMKITYAEDVALARRLLKKEDR